MAAQQQSMGAREATFLQQSCMVAVALVQAAIARGQSAMQARASAIASSMLVTSLGIACDLDPWWARVNSTGPGVAGPVLLLPVYVEPPITDSSGKGAGFVVSLCA